MNAPTGLWPITRLLLRRERRALLAWLGIIGLAAVGTAAKYKQLFNTPEAVASFSQELRANRMLIAFGGELTSSTVESLTLFKCGDVVYAMVGLMVVLMMTRHTRAEEESGRAELVTSGCVDRTAPLAAAALVSLIASALLGLFCAAGWIAQGFPVDGSLTFACAVFSNGMAFTAVAAMAAQLAQTGRGANGLAGGVLAVAYMLRFLADGMGLTWLKWMTPQGWSHLMRPYGGDHVAIIGISAVFFAVVFGWSLVLAGRRDLGAGLFPSRPGPAMARGLRSIWSLAWRLQRGMLAGWTVGFFAAGLVLGGMVGSMPDMVARGGPQMQEFFRRYASEAGGTSGVFLWVLILSLGYTLALYPALALLRLRQEEESGHAELILSSTTGRLELALSHLLAALLGTPVIMTAGAIGLCSAYGHADDAGRIVVACLLQVPAAWTLAGFVMGVVGVMPRATAAAAWSAWLFVNLFGEVLGPVLGIDYWVASKVVPFHYLPKVLSGEPVDAVPLLGLSVVTAALAAVGFIALRRRDVVM